MIIARFSQRFKDAVLEIRIKLAGINLLLSEGHEETCRSYQHLARLVSQRSPAQVARMEKQRGLA